jgi:hypothetical protein
MESKLRVFKAWLLARLDKWRVGFLVFAACYGVLLLWNLAYPSVMWDEITHLSGGMYLLRGDFQSYFAYNAFYRPCTTW